MIVILGKDKDFSHTLAEQVVRELGIACECAEDTVGLDPAQVALVVSANAEKIQGLPVLALNPPIRLAQALADIEMAVEKKDAQIAGLTLARRQKVLVHSQTGASVSLTDKEMQLLDALIAAGKNSASKETLLKTIWGFEAGVNTHTLETHIYRLRGKIKELCGSEMIAVSENGYRLLGKPHD